MIPAKPSLGARSPHWPAVEHAHLKLHPFCAACGGHEQVQVHHRKPFHLHPELELDPNNLISLCEHPSHACHFVFGHLLDWHAYNPEVVGDAAAYLKKVHGRATAA
jgi:5-methylcytosine-specific restriction protein A